MENRRKELVEKEKEMAKTIEKVISLLEERIELAEKRNFETIYLTLKPNEAKELLERIKGESE